MTTPGRVLTADHDCALDDGLCSVCLASEAARRKADTAASWRLVCADGAPRHRTHTGPVPPNVQANLDLSCAHGPHLLMAPARTPS